MYMCVCARACMYTCVYVCMHTYVAVTMYVLIQIIQQIRDHLLAGERLSKPKRCHKQIYELMQRCWYKTVKDRPRFQAIHTNLQNVTNCLCNDIILHVMLC